MAIGELIDSLHPGSTTKYQLGQIRQIDEQQVRIQGSKNGNTWEETRGASPSLCKYISALPHTLTSTAGSATMYAPCQFRQEGGTKVRIQIPGPELNRPWGAEFVMPNMAHWVGMPKGPAVAASLWACTCGFGGHIDAADCLSVKAVVFSVGDKVVVVKRGDGNGCGGGPKVGTLATVRSITQASTCGPIRIRYTDPTHGTVNWATTPEHIAFAPHIALGLPSSFLAKSGLPGTHAAYICVNCEQPAGKHYSGSSVASGDHFDPPLCPDTQAKCPACGPVGPQPLTIHKLVCTSTKVPF